MRYDHNRRIFKDKVQGLRIVNHPRHQILAICVNDRDTVSNGDFLRAPPGCAITAQ